MIKSIFNLLRFLPILGLSLSCIGLGVLATVFTDALEMKDDTISILYISLIVSIVTYLFAPPTLRQIVYLFPYKFKNKLNTRFLTILLIILAILACYLILGLNDFISEVLIPCPKPFMSDLFEPSDAAYLSLLLMIIFLLSYILLRYFNKNKVMSNIDILYLRDFAETPDRFVLRIIKSALNRKIILAFVLPPKSKISDWDPFLIAFDGSVFLPFSNLPLLFKESGVNWKEDIELFIKKARCIIFDGTVMGEGTNWEISIIRKYKAQNKTILLLNERNRSNLSLFSDLENIIYYRGKPWFLSPVYFRRTKQKLKTIIESILRKADFKKTIAERRTVDVKRSLVALASLTLLAGFYYIYIIYPENIVMAVAMNKTELVRELIETGKDAAIQDRCGNSILITAIKNKNEALVELLLQSGVSPNVVYEDNSFLNYSEDALYTAVKSGNLRIVELLVEYGSDPDSSSTSFLDNHRVLKLAIQKGDADIVGVLLGSGADPNIADESLTISTSNLEISINCNKPEIVKLLLAYGAKVEKRHIWYAVINKKREIARILAKHIMGTDEALLTEEEDGIIIAVMDGFEEKVRHYLIKGVGANIKDYDSCYLIHKAVMARNIQIIKDLIKYGADVNAQWDIQMGKGLDISTTHRVTPLHIAAKNSYYDIARLLIESGALIDSLTYRTQLLGGVYESSLYLAAENGDLQMVKLLVNSGAVIHEWSKNFFDVILSPKSIAHEKGYVDEYNYLKDHDKKRN